MSVRVKLFIATIDAVYAKLISDNISEFHTDKLEVSICSALEGLREALSKSRYDVALIDTAFIKYADMSRINLPLLLWSEADSTDELPEGIGKVHKYQRISSIVSSVLERYAKLSKSNYDPESRKANITAVWSPAGGVGKTSVALAYALSSAADGKEAFYLSLEDFTSISAFFTGNGKSISTVFEMLENHDGNINMLIQGVSCRDYGITYLCGPDNYEDMHILSNVNIHELVGCCSGLSEELVIDLPSSCDIRTRKVLELADNVLIVMLQTDMAKTKLAQFVSQNNVFESIQEKVTLIANMGAIINESAIDPVISLPFVQSGDAMGVCKMLSETELLRRKAWLKI